MENTDFAEICKSTSLENLKGFWNGVEYTEEWKDVKDYEGLYQVSSFGRVKSFCKKEIILKSYFEKIGYYTVRLSNNRRKKTKKVHQLVAIAFLGHKPCRFDIVVDHFDNNKLNNFCLNLQLVTNRENTTKDRTGSSKYTGVRLKDNRWEANIMYRKKPIYLGSFKYEDEAGRYYQEALESIKNGTEIKVKRRQCSSNYTGVCFYKKNKKWGACIKIKDKRIHLGSFKTEEEAYQRLVEYKKENGLE